MKKFMDWRHQKEWKGKFTWTIALYGTPAMADAVLDVLSGHAVVIMRNHGFVALGRTMAEANAAVEKVVAQL